jgi:hypothetical protein
MSQRQKRSTSALAETLELMPNPIVTRKALHAKQRVQSAIRPQLSGVGKAPSARQ